MCLHLPKCVHVIVAARLYISTLGHTSANNSEVAYLGVFAVVRIIRCLHSLDSTQDGAWSVDAFTCICKNRGRLFHDSRCLACLPACLLAWLHEMSALLFVCLLIMVFGFSD